MEHDDLDLRGRASLPGDPTFARRIIDAAFAQPRALGWRAQWAALWADLQQEMPVPRPALAFGVLALVGFLMGAVLQSNNGTDDTMTTYAYLFENQTGDFL
jgi:hypothetical protein